MQSSQSLLKILIFSNHSEIIDLCRTHLNVYGSVSVISTLNNYNSNSNTVLILDASSFLLNSGQADFLRDRNNNNILCIITPQVILNLKNYFELNFKNIVYFPSDTSQIIECCKKISERINKDYLFNLKKVETMNTNLMGYFQGTSALISEVREQIKSAALNDNPVLLLGETGTGKTTAANVIHKLSSRKNKDLQKVNIPSVVDTLASSSFFGTQTGAFTDAVIQEGAFKLADKGTLLLDEIGLASQKIQGILLDVIETGIIKPVGSDNDEKVDVRMIFATNSNLKLQMQKGEFRQDLYHRICDNVIYIPALRERKEDIKHIVYGVLEKEHKDISDKVLQKLEAYDWPGNIRELNKCLFRAIRNCKGSEIQEQDIEFGLFNNGSDF